MDSLSTLRQGMGRFYAESRSSRAEVCATTGNQQFLDLLALGNKLKNVGKHLFSVNAARNRDKQRRIYAH